MAARKLEKWTKRDLEGLLGNIDSWTSDARRSGQEDPILEEAGRAIRGYLRKGKVPRTVDVPSLIDDLDGYRDGRMDDFGRWLTTIMNALRSIE